MTSPIVCAGQCATATRELGSRCDRLASELLAVTMRLDAERATHAQTRRVLEDRIVELQELNARLRAERDPYVTDEPDTRHTCPTWAPTGEP